MGDIRTIVKKSLSIYILGDERFRIMSEFAQHKYRPYFYTQNTNSKVGYSIVLSHNEGAYCEDKTGFIMELRPDSEPDAMKRIYLPLREEALFNSFLYIIPPQYEDFRLLNPTEWLDIDSEMLSYLYKVIFIDSGNLGQEKNMTILTSIRSEFLRRKKPIDITIWFWTGERKMGFTDISGEEEAIEWARKNYEARGLYSNYYIIDKANLSRIDLKDPVLSQKNLLVYMREWLLNDLRERRQSCSLFFEDDYRSEVWMKINVFKKDDIVKYDESFSPDEDLISQWLISLRGFIQMQIWPLVTDFVSTYLPDLFEEQEVQAILEQSMNDLIRYVREHFGSMYLGNVQDKNSYDIKFGSKKGQFCEKIFTYIEEKLMQDMRSYVLDKIDYYSYILECTVKGSENKCTEQN